MLRKDVGLSPLVPGRRIPLRLRGSMRSPRKGGSRMPFKMITPHRVR